MAGRHPARFLAPLALVGFCLALYLVVTSTAGGPAADGGASSEEARPAGGRTPARNGRNGRATGRRTYTVRAGDTLSSIAERFNVPTSQIEDLNPRVDPQLLAPGTRIRLRR